MCVIETKYGFKGNFKLIIKMPTTATNFNLIEIGCKDQLENFILHTFKLDRFDAPQVYDPIGYIRKLIKSNKKCPKFAHEARSHVEYFTNQIEQEANESPEWEFGILDKA